MKVLICGGTRFYGLTLVKKLVSENFDVTVLSRSKEKDLLGVRRIIGELNENMVQTFTRESFDIVINNICMNENDAKKHVEYLSNLAKSHIVISSIGVYHQKGLEQIPKEENFLPLDSRHYFLDEPYHDKRQAERLLSSTLSVHELYILRPSVILGINDWTNRLGFYIQRLLDGQGIITCLNGSSYFQWTYDWQLADVVIDIMRCPNRYKESIYNVAINKQYTFIEFLLLLCSILGIKQFKLLPLLDIKPYSLPYDKFRDPYGKENCICCVDRLREINSNLTDAGDNKLEKIVQETAKKLEQADSPNYIYRNLEIEFIKKHRNLVKMYEIQ